MPRKPKSFNNTKQNTICYLVAAGVSLRQAARHLKCDPKSIRTEAARNDKFRAKLEQAKSDAVIKPLQTLQDAAATNWRAALHWIERIDPDRFARSTASVLTKREANLFVDDLLAAIEKAFTDSRERRRFVKLLSPTMPAVMRRKWQMKTTRPAVEQATQDFERDQKEREQQERLQRKKRDERRRSLWYELKEWLPSELSHKLDMNRDLLDPEEVLSQAIATNGSPSVSESGTQSTADMIRNAFADVPKKYRPGSHALKMREIDFDCAPKPYTSHQYWNEMTQEECNQAHADLIRRKAEFLAPFTMEDLTASASPASEISSPDPTDSSPVGRIMEESASPPLANPNPDNDLQEQGEDKSTP